MRKAKFDSRWESNPGLFAATETKKKSQNREIITKRN